MKNKTNPRSTAHNKRKSPAHPRAHRTRKPYRAQPTFHAKQRGELVEMMFMLQATLRGLIVAKPYGDSRRYDFITDAGQRPCRVQVKSTTHRSGNGYIVNATSRRHSRQIYTARDIDFLIAYVIPRNAWYMVPVSKLKASTFIVYPDGHCPGPRYGRYEQYREAWHLLGDCHLDALSKLLPAGSTAIVCGPNPWAFQPQPHPF
jgi:hypothetical protein